MKNQEKTQIDMDYF